MSVLKNKRSLSELEFYNNAVALRAELTRFVMNENNVPKRWRPVFSFPIIAKVCELFDNITMANTVYPTTEHELEFRRDFQNLAIGNVNQLLQLLQYLLTTLELNADKLMPITKLLLDEERLLKGWRKSGNNKVMPANGNPPENGSPTADGNPPSDGNPPA